MDQFLRATRFSYRYFQTLAGSLYGIRWLPHYSMLDEPFSGTDGILLGGTYEQGVWDLGIDLAAQKRILAGHTKIYTRIS